MIVARLNRLHSSLYHIVVVVIIIVIVIVIIIIIIVIVIVIVITIVMVIVITIVIVIVITTVIVKVIVIASGWSLPGKRLCCRRVSTRGSLYLRFALQYRVVVVYSLFIGSLLLSLVSCCVMSLCISVCSIIQTMWSAAISPRACCSEEHQS